MEPQKVRISLLKFFAHRKKAKEKIPTFSEALDEAARMYGHENYQAYRDFMKREAPDMLKTGEHHERDWDI